MRKLDFKVVLPAASNATAKRHLWVGMGGEVVKYELGPTDNTLNGFQGWSGNLVQLKLVDEDHEGTQLDPVRATTELDETLEDQFPLGIVLPPDPPTLKFTRVPDGGNYVASDQ